MVNKKYIIKKGESGLYTIYRKSGDGYTYQMAVNHKDIAEQVCHLLNIEWKKTNDELLQVKREFFEYRMEHPEDE